MTLQGLAKEACDLAGKLFYDGEGSELGCTGGGSESCLMREEARPLTVQERKKGWARRPFFAYEENNLCGTCCAYWHAQRAAQILHELDCLRRKSEARRV
jgi:hypothetical protein